MLLALRLLLGLLFTLELGKKLFSLFFRDGGLSLELGAFLLELLADDPLVFLQSVLHLSHLCFIDGNDDVRLTRFSWDTWLSSLDIDLATGKLGELLSKTCDLVMELSDHSILRVLIDTRLVLDMLGARSVTQGR